ncbi:hypothetical protein C0583_02140 [Candidatus Parcubacteria bacterium]|nr:MAG: hypothetical protein C0583_02140 [Candidatus Parcubacteria bacterium]
MENKFKNKLRELVESSNLNENKKLLWDIFLNISIADEDEAIYEAASESTENLELLTGHLRDKIWDMKENNEKAWKKLIADEEKYAHILG